MTRETKPNADPSPRAHELQQDIDKPLMVTELSSEVGHGTHDYEVYVRTAELLSLQHSSDERVHPDELAFQIVHQVQELWLRLLAQECVALVDRVDRDRWSQSQRVLERCQRILRSLCEAMDVLSTLTPAAFQVIRRSLGDGSGLQSPGFAAFRRAATAIDESLKDAFERAGVSLEHVYQTEEPAHLLTLAESLVDFDVAFQRWLVEHFHLVRRTIGVDRKVSALDGFPTKALEVRMKRPLFPELWELRVELTQEWKRDGGIAPGCPRSTG